MNDYELEDAPRATHFPRCPQCLENGDLVDLVGATGPTHDVAGELLPRELLARLGMYCPQCDWMKPIAVDPQDDGGFEVGERVRITDKNGSAPACEGVVIHRVYGTLRAFGEFGGQRGWVVELAEPIETMMGTQISAVVIPIFNLETELSAG